MPKGTFAGKRSRRLSRQLSRWAERIALGSLLLFLLGLGGMMWAQGGARGLGAAFAAVGLIGIGLHARSLWQARNDRQRMLQATVRRAGLQAARRERAGQVRLRRTAEADTRARSAERLDQARSAQKQAAAQSAREVNALRVERERRVEAEAFRLYGLTDNELHTELVSLFALQDCSLRAADSEYPGDFLLESSAGNGIVRCLPAFRKGSGADVEALEAWREHSDVPRAFLVAASGFLPSAVASLASLPITLVEPHLLAHWKLTAEAKASL